METRTIITCDNRTYTIQGQTYSAEKSSYIDINLVGSLARPKLKEMLRLFIFDVCHYDNGDVEWTLTNKLANIKSIHLIKTKQQEMILMLSNDGDVFTLKMEQNEEDPFPGFRDIVLTKIDFLTNISRIIIDSPSIESSVFLIDKDHNISKLDLNTHPISQVKLAIIANVKTIVQINGGCVYLTCDGNVIKQNCHSGEQFDLFGKVKEIVSSGRTPNKRERRLERHFYCLTESNQVYKIDQNWQFFSCVAENVTRLIVSETAGNRDNQSYTWKAIYIEFDDGRLQYLNGPDLSKDVLRLFSQRKQQLSEMICNRQYLVEKSELTNSDNKLN